MTDDVIRTCCSSSLRDRAAVEGVTSNTTYRRHDLNMQNVCGRQKVKTKQNWTKRERDHWRCQEFVLRGLENRGAVGADFETPKVSMGEGNGEGIPLPHNSRLEGLGPGERRKLPQRGPEQSPDRKRILCILSLKKIWWWRISFFSAGGLAPQRALMPPSVYASERDAVGIDLRACV